MKTELKKELEALEQKVAEIRKAIEAEEAKEAKEWPKKWDEYFYMNNSVQVGSFIWEGDEIDQHLLSIGNVHRTGEDAEKWLERKQLEHKMDEGGNVQVYRDYEGKWRWVSTTCQHYGHFKTVNVAETFLSDPKNIELLNKHYR